MNDKFGREGREKRDEESINKRDGARRNYEGRKGRD